jgi:hypothetical protein
MDRYMNEGDIKTQTITDTVLDPQLRGVLNSGNTELKVLFKLYHSTWHDVDSGLDWNDVIE